jgi:multidrug efflux pump subunit AcrB
MWIVQLALKRPHTFVVMAMLIVVLGATAIQQMRTDIFPEIDIPVITVIWYPTGVARIDTHEYPVTLNNTPITPDSFNTIPVKVIGGLLVATLTTLLFVPVVYSLLRSGRFSKAE